jgi:hypothetical protein
VIQDEFKALVCGTDAKEFVKDQLFDLECWLFKRGELIAPGTSYPKFRREIARLLEVNQNEIILVGSSKFGFSMSPRKAWRAFDPEVSDLDCAIISEPLFRETVDAIRRAYFEGYSHLHQDHAGQIFAGHVVLSGSKTYKSRYLRDVALRLADLQRVALQHLRFEPDVKYRVYESFRVAEAYHTEGVKALQSQEAAR